MPTWEYGYLKFHTDDDGRKAKLFFEGEQAKRYDGEEADLLAILNSLGQDGWDAISHTYDQSVEGVEEQQWMSILLKRAKQWPELETTAD